jgi:hypothetical protein
MQTNTLFKLRAPSCFGFNLLFILIPFYKILFHNLLIPHARYNPTEVPGTHGIASYGDPTELCHSFKDDHYAVRRGDYKLCIPVLPRYDVHLRPRLPHLHMLQQYPQMRGTRVTVFLRICTLSLLFSSQFRANDSTMHFIEMFRTQHKRRN